MRFQEQENHMFNSSWEIGSDIDQALAPANLVKFPKFRNFRLIENLAATSLDLLHSTPPLSIAESKILSYNFLGIKIIKNNKFQNNAKFNLSERHSEHSPPKGNPRDPSNPSEWDCPSPEEPLQKEAL